MQKRCRYILCAYMDTRKRGLLDQKSVVDMHQVSLPDLLGVARGGGERGTTLQERSLSVQSDTRDEPAFWYRMSLSIVLVRLLNVFVSSGFALHTLCFSPINTCYVCILSGHG